MSDTRPLPTKRGEGAAALARLDDYVAPPLEWPGQHDPATLEGYEAGNLTAAELAAEAMQHEIERADAADRGQPFEAVMATVTPEPVEWLWPRYVPLGKLTMLDGDPGVSKSTMLLDLAARVSRGYAMPDGSGGGRPAGVVILSAEDDLADTIVPRLMAAGADLERIAYPRGEAAGEMALLTLPEEVARLEALVRQYGAALVIIDPFMAYLSDTVKTGLDHNVRRALAPLAGLAARTGAALVLIRHLNKNADQMKAIYRGGGSIGISGAARAVLLLAEDPDDQDTRVLAPVKSNLGRLAPALSFRVVETGDRYGAVRIDWTGETSRHTAVSILAPHLQASEDDIEAALTEIMADGDVLARDGWRRLEERDIDTTRKQQIWRRQRRLGLEVVKRGYPGRWWWTLAPTDPSQS